jgi:O-antigen ligase
LTFTSRTIIWARAYEHLVNKHRLLFGNGYETKEILLILGLSHAHNTWLNFLYRGGIILMTSMAVITYIASKRLNIYMHTKNLHGKIIGMYLIFYMICFLTEANDGGSNFYMFLVTLYFIFNFDQLSQQQTS